MLLSNPILGSIKKKRKKDLLKMSSANYGLKRHYPVRVELLATSDAVGIVVVF